MPDLSGRSSSRRRAVLVGLSTPLAVAAALVATAVPAAAAGSWPQFGQNAAHTQIAATTTISPSTVAGLTRTFQATLPDSADGPPVYQGGVTTASGTRDLLFAMTRSGTLTAVDAHSGAAVWTHTVGPGSCHINNGSSTCYTTSQPAVDPRGTFVYGYGLDGRVHRYATGTGVETTTGGWPELATAKPFDEKGSSDLATATVGSTDYLYVANGGYPGDRGDYQGHLTTINLQTGAQHVFNTQCSAQAVHFVERPATPDCGQVQSAVWARPGAVYDAALNRVFIATGNADYSPAAGDWGDSVIALSPDGSASGGNPLDSYTPSNYQSLQNGDLDLGSTAPTLVPSPTGSSVAHLGVQSGKDGQLRLLNLADLSGRGGPGHTGGELGIVAVPQGGEVLTQPLAWTDPKTGTPWVFVVTSRGISGLRVGTAGGVPKLSPAWTVGTGGFTPVVAGGVLFYLTPSGAVALNPSSGATLWADHAGSIGLHWNSPIVVNGSLYYTDGHAHLVAYSVADRPVPSTGSTLGTGATLSAGHSLVSPSGQYQLVMQTDGNLVEYGNGRALWNTHTFVRRDYLIMQGDGNLVLYGPDRAVLWQNARSGVDTALTLQNDGNLVEYQGSTPLWSNRDPGSNLLTVGGHLAPSWYLHSPNFRYTLILQTDHNLVLYGPGGRPLWSTGTRTAGDASTQLVDQADGNLVLYVATRAVFATMTKGTGNQLVVQDDGNVVVYSASGAALWSTHTRQSS